MRFAIDLHQVAQLFLNRRIPGGCDDCDAWQTFVEADGYFDLTVHHDDTCPWLAARKGNRS